MVRLFVKPNMTPRQEIDKVENELYLKTKAYEALSEDYDKKEIELRASYEANKIKKEKEIEELDGVISIKRKEREILEKPLNDKTQFLNARENKLKEKEEELKSKEEKLEDKERDLAQMIDLAENRLDEISEFKMQIDNREKIIDGKEQILKDRETKFIQDVAIRNSQYDTNCKALNEKIESFTKYINEIKAKEAEFDNREKEIKKQLEKIASQRKVLLLAKQEITDKINKYAD